MNPIVEWVNKWLMPVIGIALGVVWMEYAYRKGAGEIMTFLFLLVAVGWYFGTRKS